MPINFTRVILVFVDTPSLANKRVCWQAMGKIAAKQKRLASIATANAMHQYLGHIGDSFRIKIIRYSSRAIPDTSDNLPRALKHIKDGIANGLGIDDKDTDKLSWSFENGKKFNSELKNWIEAFISFENLKIEE